MKFKNCALLLITIVSFLGACLLFFVQPFTARLFLPLAGGSPSLWNSCMLFFQTLLLLGYTFSHLCTTFLHPRRQLLAAFVVLVLPFFFFPILLPSNPPPTIQDPTLWFLLSLFSTVGTPFFALAIVSPLLQKWLSITNLPGSKDPYFLYAASNIGSLIGLLSYPLLIEPLFGVSEQSWIFSLGYKIFFLGIIIAGFLCTYIFRTSSEAASVDAVSDKGLPQEIFPAQLSEVASLKRDSSESVSPVVPSVILLSSETLPTVASLPAEPSLSDVSSGKTDFPSAIKWIALAFIPSSLSMGVTHHISTEIAAIPLFWTIPLALYLITYILAFSPRAKINLEYLSRALALLLTFLGFTFLRMVNEPIILILPLHLLTFFFSALLCHRTLANLRPPSNRITTFYLLIAVGGACGGIFNTLVSPLLFNSILEYPLVLALVCWVFSESLKPGKIKENGNKKNSGFRVKKSSWPLAIPALLAVWMPGITLFLGNREFMDPLLMFMRDIIPSIAAYLVSFSRPAYAFSILVLYVFSTVIPSAHGKLIWAERTFFGVHRVTISHDEKFVQLVHGTTIHGIQARNSMFSGQPSAYFHPSGPIGQVFQFLRKKANDGKIPEVGIIGLGAGSIAAYGKKGERFSFFEIDPAVIRIAQNPKFFTFVHDSQAEIRFVVGDGRRSVQNEPVGNFNLFILDAFSSDSVPMHLLTHEAFTLYLDRIKNHGLLVFHISNKYLSMESVLSATLKDLGLFSLIQEDINIDEMQEAQGKAISTWLIAARNEEDLGSLVNDKRWRKPKIKPGQTPWTDDKGTLLDALELAWLR
ncbi:MAG: fused MFS/spermidine synthase [Candidatus Riflebacteria bacterium]|nr:fused MFS/spermidine synthase [Candidatus Riflebacteria bacterium]